jgi:nucleotide-binding universal stress UspA family protein
MTRISKILFPTNFSDLSEAALKYAIQFATDYRATLHVIYGVDNACQFSMGAYPGMIPNIMPRVDAMGKEAEKGVQRLAAERIGQSVKTVTKVLVGRPFEEINNYAANQVVDLIVIGTHGLGGVTHMLLGSVAEKVVRTAPCPVLTVHRPEHEFVQP